MKYISLFESFKFFQDDKILLEFLDKNSEIYESSLSRIWQHIEGDKSFGVISPFRKYYSKKENMERYNELKKIVRDKLKLGFIEMEGGFKEEGDWVHEKSLFIPNIKKEDLIDLGEKFDQYSVIYKDSNEFIEIGTNDFSVKGQILNNFIKKGWDKNIQINSELTKKELFSKLIKGSHRDRKFLFNLKESYLLEIDPKSFNESYPKTNGDKGGSKKRYIRLV
jgi:hypothetical protein